MPSCLNLGSYADVGAMFPHLTQELDARLGHQYESREFGEERPKMGI